MNKEEYIGEYGKVAYEKMRQQSRDWNAAHREEGKVSDKKWREAHREEDNAKSREWRKDNPEKVKASSQEYSHKGGKYYEKALKYNRTGLQGERRIIRWKHTYLYRNIKQATPNSVTHHEWIPGTAKYRGVALVDKEAHQNGIIKVTQILEGKITLLTEKEIRGQEKKN